jgi:hypothetical protein
MALGIAMKFNEILRETDQRILCYRPSSQGMEFAICKEMAEGEFEPIPHCEPVTVRKATRRWIGHALFTLSWNRGDFDFVAKFLQDPRIEMNWTHPARGRVLTLPKHVMPQDGYRQLGSVWCLNGQRFAACISDTANQPEWWGEQIAATMEQIVCTNIDGERERKASLGAILASYHDVLGQPSEEMRFFASRFDWMNATSSFEVISIWHSSEGQTLTLLFDDLFDEPHGWGLPCAALTHEVVETLCVERQEQRQQIIEALTPPYSARLSKARMEFEKAAATVQ